MLTDQAQDVMVTDQDPFLRKLAGFYPWAPTVTSSWDNLNINFWSLKAVVYAFHQIKMVLVSVYMGYITQKVLKQCGLVADPVPR